MREEKQTPGITDTPLNRVTVLVHATPCYDFLVSLRALYNPRIYERSRTWAAKVRTMMSAELYSVGRFYFQGADTALGYGVLRLIAELPGDASPDALLSALRATPARECALLMLDTGDLQPHVLETFRSLVGGRLTSHDVDRGLRGVPAIWAAKYRRILANPAAVQLEFAAFLESYWRLVFHKHVPAIREVVATAAKEATKILEVLPTQVAIERLTGGYTLAPDLSLTRITLAPSVFGYPYIASRVDEVSSTALVVFGVRNDDIIGFEHSPIELDLASVLKVLSSEARLRILRKVANQPMMTADLVAALGLSQTTIHHHLHQLRTHGLLHQERTHDGLRHSARSEEIARIAQQLRNLLPPESR